MQPPVCPRIAIRGLGGLTLLTRRAVRASFPRGCGRRCRRGGPGRGVQVLAHQRGIAAAEAEAVALHRRHVRVDGPELRRGGVGRPGTAPTRRRISSVASAPSTTTVKCRLPLGGTVGRPAARAAASPAPPPAPGPGRSRPRRARCGPGPRSPPAASRLKPQQQVDPLDQDERDDEGVGRRGHDGGDELDADLGRRGRVDAVPAEVVGAAGAAPLTSGAEANTPVRMAPRKPPTPWTPKASSESSYLSRGLRQTAA